LIVGAFVLVAMPQAGGTHLAFRRLASHGQRSVHASLRLRERVKRPLEDAQQRPTELLRRAANEQHRGGPYGP
jgi:hypothetical protein